MGTSNHWFAYFLFSCGNELTGDGAVRLSGQKKQAEGTMTATNYIKGIRGKIVFDLLLIPSVAAAILNDRNELLLQEKYG